MKLNCLNRSDNGLTLIELLVNITLIVIVTLVLFVGIGGVIMGNEWFTREGVLKEIQMVNTNTVDVVACRRHVFSKSIVYARESSGRLQKYSLKSNILFNYDLKPMDSDYLFGNSPNK